MRKLGQKRAIFFLKCTLKKTKATKKQLKRSKKQKSKESKFVMLDSLAACFFMSLNVKKINTGLNK